MNLSKTDKPLNAIIIDDERMARQELLRLLKKHPQINVVAQAENIDQGFDEIEKHQPDIIFLDIEMPGGTGLTLAEKLKGEIPIVFCTAYDEFAVDAFALNAIDYLVKPIVPERLAETINKFSELEKTTEETTLNDDFKLMVKFGDHMKIIRLGDISRFESIGNHAAIYTPQGKAYLHSSLNKIEARLNTNTYFRASRVDILRLDAIEKLEQTVNYGLMAQLRNNVEVEISRRQASKLKTQLGFPS
ncbi:MAG: response regulator transcription factor [Colwellia sp.]|jgi:two-component system LytT family response regulator|uniref:LytR/AlgR family response regulator transcription factor n=1 Tax=Colwellia sp. Bg11-12 TaxID=2759817 RepID=UPI0015F763B9|nr:response regulator transcription factor [Colwellia sp. Bg11-12]MBA6263824.1 response regulator transcription factor [Colwellia sp. Bg11-12]